MKNKKNNSKIIFSIKLLITLVIFSIPGFTAFGREIIVDASGGGNYTTITAAETASAPGDTITVRPGTYSGRVTINTSGTASLPIIYISTGARVIGGFDIIGNYITVQGFNVDTQGIRTKGHYNQVLDNQISDVSSYGIEVVGHWPEYGNIYTETTYNLVKGNTIVRAHTAGIQVMGSYNVIENNDISHTLTTGDADGLRFFGRGHIIKGNRIHNITVAEAGGSPHIDCFQTWRDAVDMLFEGNFCHLQDNSMQGTMIEQEVAPVGNLTFIRNVFVMDATGYGPGINILCDYGHVNKIQTVKIYHNTFVRTRENGDSGGQYSIWLTDVNNADVRNNIFYDGITPAINTAYCTNLTKDYNLFYSPKDSLTFTMSAHDLWGDPLFTNFYSDLTLRSGSPAINSGVDLGYSYVNGADRGAFEYQAVQDTTPPSPPTTLTVN